MTVSSTSAPTSGPTSGPTSTSASTSGSTSPSRPTLAALLRGPATLVWLVLIAATALSWMLGTDHGFASASHEAPSVAILLVAFIKIRFIGLWFMELREAPMVLRALFETYCVVVCVLTISLFLLA